MYSHINIGYDFLKVCFFLFLAISSIKGSTITIGSKTELNKCWRVYGEDKIELGECAGDEHLFKELMPDGLSSSRGTKLESVSNPGFCISRAIDGFQIQSYWYTVSNNFLISSTWCLNECLDNICNNNNPLLPEGSSSVMMLNSCSKRSSLWVNSGSILQNVESERCLSICEAGECGSAFNSGTHLKTVSCLTPASVFWNKIPSPSYQDFYNFTSDQTGTMCLDTCMLDTVDCNNFNGYDVISNLPENIEGRLVFLQRCGSYFAGENQAWKMVSYPSRPELKLVSCEDIFSSFWTYDNSMIQAIRGNLEVGLPCASLDGSVILMEDCSQLTESANIQWSIKNIDETVGEMGGNLQKNFSYDLLKNEVNEMEGTYKKSGKSKNEDINTGIIAAIVILFSVLTISLAYFVNKYRKRLTYIREAKAHLQNYDVEKPVKEPLALPVPQNLRVPSTKNLRKVTDIIKEVDISQEGYSAVISRKDKYDFTESQLKRYNTRRGKSVGKSIDGFDCDKELQLDEDLSNVLNAVSTLTEGILFAGRYIIESRRAIGSGGVVLFAKNKFNKDSVAIKFFASKQAFQRAQDVQHLISPNSIARLDDVVIIENFPPALVFQRGDYTLSDLLKRSHPSALSQKLCLSQILNSLSDLHSRNIIHRDIKPSNIMWFSLDHSWKLTDLDTWALVGEKAPISYTLMYACPEVVIADIKEQESVILETSADMWSFGIVAYEIITGMRFYGHETAPEDIIKCFLGERAMPDLNAVKEPQAKRLIQNLLNLDPKSRWMATTAINNAFFRSAEDTKQQQDKWNKVSDKLDRLQEIIEITSEEILGSNLMLSITMDYLKHSGDIPLSRCYTKCPGSEVLLASDDALPGQPIFMLNLSESYRINVTICHDKSLVVKVTDIKAIRIISPEGVAISLVPEVVNSTNNEFRVAALWNTAEHRCPSLDLPTSSFGPLDKRIVILDVEVVLMILNNDSKETIINGKLYCKMHKSGTKYTAQKFIRKMNDTWLQAPQWMRNGAKGMIILVHTAAAVTTA